MESKARLPFESLATCRKATHEGLLAGVDPLVGLEVELLAESLPAADDVAYKRGGGGGPLGDGRDDARQARDVGEGGRVGGGDGGHMLGRGGYCGGAGMRDIEVVGRGEVSFLVGRLLLRVVDGGGGGRMMGDVVRVDRERGGDGLVVLVRVVFVGGGGVRGGDCCGGGGGGGGGLGGDAGVRLLLRDRWCERVLVRHRGGRREARDAGGRGDEGGWLTRRKSDSTRGLLRGGGCRSL